VKFLGKLVQALRQERGITQQSLALSVGCSVGTISKIEQGSVKPGLEMARNIAHALGREVEIDPESIAAYSEETGLSPEALRPSSHAGGFASQNSKAVEMLPLITRAINRVGIAHVEVLLRGLADPTLFLELLTAHHERLSKQEPPPAVPNTPSLISAKLHGDRVVRIYDKPEPKAPAAAKPMPRRRTG